MPSDKFRPGDVICCCDFHPMERKPEAVVRFSDEQVVTADLVETSKRISFGKDPEISGHHWVVLYKADSETAKKVRAEMDHQKKWFHASFFNSTA